MNLKQWEESVLDEHGFYGNFLFACAEGELAIIKKYISERKIDPNMVNDEGRTGLHMACCYNHPDVFNFLMSLGVDLHRKGYRGKTALHYAAEMPNADHVVRLIEAGADVNCQDDYGNTPLHYACEDDDSIDILIALCARGANPCIKNKDGLDPEELAKENENISAIEFFKF